MTELPFESRHQTGGRCTAAPVGPSLLLGSEAPQASQVSTRLAPANRKSGAYRTRLMRANQRSLAGKPAKNISNLIRFSGQAAIRERPVASLRPFARRHDVRQLLPMPNAYQCRNSLVGFPLPPPAPPRISQKETKGCRDRHGCCSVNRSSVACLKKCATSRVRLSGGAFSRTGNSRAF